jgi:hypothetical protein
MTRHLRAAALAALLLPLGGCIIETDSPPARPAPIVLQPAAPTGTVVVQPQP